MKRNRLASLPFLAMGGCPIAQAQGRDTTVRRIGLPFLLAFLMTVVASTASSQAKRVDAGNVGEALSMGAIEILHVDEVRKSCDEKLPKAKTLIDHYAYVWRLDNQDEIDAIDSFMSSHPDPKFAMVRDAMLKAMLPAQNAAMASNADRFCSGFVGELKSGNRNFAHRTPEVARYLKDYLHEHPLSATASARKDERIGCLKEGMNKGMDYDRMVSFCNCTMDVFDQGMSPAEHAQFLDVVNRKGDAAALPQFKRILPRLNACANAMKQAP